MSLQARPLLLLWYVEKIVEAGNTSIQRDNNSQEILAQLISTELQYVRNTAATATQQQ